MKLSELLTRKRVLVPLAVDSFEAGVLRLLHAMDPSAREHGERGAVLPPEDRTEVDRLLERLRRGEGGRIRTPSPRTALLVLREGTRSGAALGVSPDPLAYGSEGVVRVILLVRIGAGTRIRDEALDDLASRLADPEVEGRLLTAPDVDAILGTTALLGLGLDGERKVKDALTPMSYRIYPETPLGEVADLMARKNLAAVPVVGEGLQVLGIISSGEALRHALRGRGGESMAGILARDVMSRAVLCVTEDQELLDAGKIMANRDLAQLPVVRDGEIVGFLTREAVLRALISDER